MDILKGVRPVDVALTALMAALAVVIAVTNMNADGSTDLAHSLDSQSPLMIPVFLAAALPILWRRRAILPAIAVSFVIVAMSIPAFGWVTRCGFALPLSVAMAYAVARFAGSREKQLLGLVGILALQTVTLMKDAATGGLEPLMLSIPAAALFYGIGLGVQTLAEKRAAQPTSAEHVHA